MEGKKEHGDPGEKQSDIFVPRTEWDKLIRDRVKRDLNRIGSFPPSSDHSDIFVPRTEADILGTNQSSTEKSQPGSERSSRDLHVIVNQSP